MSVVALAAKATVWVVAALALTVWDRIVRWAR